MRAAPDGLDDAAVANALERGWHVRIEEIDYAAVGAGSYHWSVADASGRRSFVTVDDLATKSWLADSPDRTFDGLRRAFATAAALQASGLDFVVAPLATVGGDWLLRLSRRYSIALFPFIEGTAAPDGRYESDEDLLAVTAMLARLHEKTSDVRSQVGTAGLVLPGRRHLEAALAELDRPWEGGPLSEAARRAIRSGAGELISLIELAERLSAAAARGETAWVVTHGEPHAANVMKTDGRSLLVDWDTVALGPPERDLWMLAGDVEAREAYERATGIALDESVVDYFRLTWDLRDIAEYLNVLRSPHDENADTLRAYHALSRIGSIHASWMSRN